MRRSIKLLVLLGAAVALGGLAVFILPTRPADDFRIYGNVELRQISLAFENGGRVTEMLAEEGDRVRAGQVLARQDKSALELSERQASARLKALEQAVLRLKNGARPEELAQARARVESARAQADFASRQDRRMETLAGRERAVSQQDRESSRSARDVAAANLEEAQKSLELLEIGPRDEDIAQAEAEAEAARASLASMRWCAPACWNRATWPRPSVRLFSFLSIVPNGYALTFRKSDSADSAPGTGPTCSATAFRNARYPAR